jgi:AcrR family transcriptional regulator
MGAAAGVRTRTAPDAEGGEALLRVALSLFVEQGYHGASMRDIATRAGVSVSAAYHYFPSKADMLRTIMIRVTEDLIADLAAARDGAGPDPAAQLAAVARAHVLLHTRRQDESFIGNSELRSLAPADRRKVVALRDRVGQVFKDIVAEGCRRGVFQQPDSAETVRAILTMCTAVAGWYRANGPDEPEIVAGRYAALALRLVGHDLRPRAARGASGRL